MERGEGARGADPSTGEDGQTPDEAEEKADAKGDPWIAGERGEDDQDVDGRRLDVGGDARADLPAEAGGVDPGTVGIEPALVDLTMVDGERGGTRFCSGGQK